MTKTLVRLDEASFIKRTYHPVVNVGTRRDPDWVKKIGRLQIACDPPPGASGLEDPRFNRLSVRRPEFSQSYAQRFVLFD